MEDGKMVVSLRTKSPAPQPPAPAPVEHLPHKAAPRKRRGRAAIVWTICAIVVGGALGWFAFSHRPGASAGTVPASFASSSVETDQQTAAQTATIIAEVGRLIDLPPGETPTVATVTDPSKLEDQPFFANAKAGDIVLLYSVAREAYLYDPTQNKLVEVAPITTSATSQ